MKKLLKNYEAESAINANLKEDRIVENKLYNLLFAGNISIKEYLKELKEKEVHKRAA